MCGDAFGVLESPRLLSNAFHLLLFLSAASQGGAFIRNHPKRPKPTKPTLNPQRTAAEGENKQECVRTPAPTKLLASGNFPIRSALFGAAYFENRIQPRIRDEIYKVKKNLLDCGVYLRHSS